MDLHERRLSCPIGPCPSGRKEFVGHSEAMLNAGDEIEILAGLDEILKAEVPEGKYWKLNVSVDIIEL